MGRAGESYTTARSHLRPDGDPGRPDRFRAATGHGRPGLTTLAGSYRELAAAGYPGRAGPERRRPPAP
jgi:hypothetical protein